MRADLTKMNILPATGVATVDTAATSHVVASSAPAVAVVAVEVELATVAETVQAATFITQPSEDVSIGDSASPDVFASTATGGESTVAVAVAVPSNHDGGDDGQQTSSPSQTAALIPSLITPSTDVAIVDFQPAVVSPLGGVAAVLAVDSAVDQLAAALSSDEPSLPSDQRSDVVTRIDAVVRKLAGIRRQLAPEPERGSTIAAIPVSSPISGAATVVNVDMTSALDAIMLALRSGLADRFPNPAE